MGECEEGKYRQAGELGEGTDIRGVTRGDEDVEGAPRRTALGGGELCRH